MIQQPLALRMQCPPIPLVRIGLIGLGQRGMQTLQRYAFVKGAEIRCLADLEQERLDAGNDALQESGRPPARPFIGKEAWREVCRQQDIDLIYICTDWNSHAEIAIEAMNCGKHVAVEVPAATTIEECRALVKTAEQTRRHCFMTENCCYDWFALATQTLHAKGYFGTITHCEGAYIHDWRELFSAENDAARTWYRSSCLHGGNPYPTHGIGPIAQLLGIHRKDRFKHLVSVTGQAAGKNSLLGHTNTSLITTESGITVLLQFDGTTPRPYSRIQGICGTQGFAQKYPLLHLQHEGKLHEGAEAEIFLQKYLKGHAAELWLEGRSKGVPNEMNYAMDCRLIYCLQKGLPLDIDVYDAAEWSCLSELTRLSAQQGGALVEFPDFLNLSVEADKNSDMT
nr:Gfo/Idh/MocA family oxidoreductase [Alloprevotella sp. OH1205_COT-284]